MNQELNNWILQARSTGHTDEQIKQYLVSHGYNTQQIEDAFLNLDAPSEQSEPDTNTPTDVTDTQSEPVAVDNSEPKSEEINSELLPEEIEQIESDSLNTDQAPDTELITEQEPVVESKESSQESDNLTPEPTPELEPETASKIDDSVTAVPSFQQDNPTEEKPSTPEPTLEDTSNSDGVSLSFQASKPTAEQQVQELESTPVEQVETDKSEAEPEINNQDIKNIEQQIDSIYEPDNHSTNYQKKSSIIPTLLFLLLLFGGMFGAYYYYTNFMNPKYVEPEVVIEQSIPAAKIIPKVEPEPIEIEPEEVDTPPEPIELPEPQEPIEQITQEPELSLDK